LLMLGNEGYCRKKYFLECQGSRENMQLPGLGHGQDSWARIIPHFSPAIRYNAAMAGVYCVGLVKYSQRTESTPVGVFLRPPCIHALSRRFATNLVRSAGYPWQSTH